MQINSLTLFQFRNYTQQEARFAPGLNLILGDNAQGKTNLLEAVFYFGAGKSHREARDAQLIQRGQSEARLTAQVFCEGRGQTLDVRFNVTARKEIYINDIKAKSPRELTGKLPCVLFGPDELRLVGGGAEQRRRFMNLALCQLYPRYLAQLAAYKRLHEHKNKLLRTADPRSGMAAVLPEFNRRLAETGAALLCRRAAFVDQIAALAAPIQREMGGETLSVSYRTVSGVDPRQEVERVAADYLHKLEEHEASEWAARTCLYGPHRDNIEVFLDGAPLLQVGSQGQRRTAALALKLSERALFRQTLGDEPLLLLDDVLSELDAHRRAYVLDRLSGGQILITGCDPVASFPHDANRLVVCGGQLTRDNEGRGVALPRKGLTADRSRATTSGRPYKRNTPSRFCVDGAP